MAKPESTIELKADASDPDDFDVTAEAIERALEERRERKVCNIANEIGKAE